MNITLVHTWRVINAKGGTEKVFCDMANALSNRGHNVTAIFFDQQTGEPGFLFDKNVTLINAAVTRTPFLLSSFFRKVRAFNFSQELRRNRRAQLESKIQLFKIHNALLSISSDVIVSFQAETTYKLKQIFKNKAPAPIVTMIHNDPIRYLPPTMSIEIKRSVESSAFVHVLRPEFKDSLLSILPHASVIVIPNAVPQTQDLSDCLGKTIINIGRLMPEKRQSLLVEAFALIKDEFPKWKLELWGETHLNPEYTQKIKAIIEENKLKNQVNICGTTENVLQQLKRAGIFAFPSEFEGMPLALTEGMTMGLPSIGWKECPAVNTLIRNGENGLLCDATPESLAHALTTLMKDTDLRIRLGKQAKEDMKAYAPEKVWNQWESLLLSLVNSKNIE